MNGIKNIKGIRRQLFHSIHDDKNFVKALALSVFVKNAFRSSTITNFTINKLHKITGLHATTLQKRIKTLKAYGLIDCVGANKQHLVFKSISSHNALRNINVEHITASDIRTLENELLALVLIETQKQKDYVKHLLSCAYNPSKYDDYKSARKKCRSYGYDNKDYKEYGISYKTLAKKMNVSLKKAFSVVKYAIECGYVSMIKRQEQFFEMGVGNRAKYMEDDTVTFYTKNNAYKILANTYTLNIATA